MNEEKDMKHLLRSFAAGLFSAGVIMLAAYYFSEESREELTADEMIPIVEEEGYHVLTSDEYISLAVQPKDKEENTEEKAETKQEDKKEKAENKEKEEQKEEENNNEKKEDKQPETSSYTLQIKPGMLTPEITELLEENKIIDDAAKFNRYLEEHEYSPKIQIGNFKLTSDMDYYQIAETITDYKRGQ